MLCSITIMNAIRTALLCRLRCRFGCSTSLRVRLAFVTTTAAASHIRFGVRETLDEMVVRHATE